MIDMFRQATALDEDFGGKSMLILGTLGSNKTSLLCGLAERAVSQGEKVIWHGKPIDSWHNIKAEHVWIHRPAEMDIALYLQERRRSGSRTNLFDTRDDIDLIPYTGPFDFMTHIKEGLNIVYLAPYARQWKELFWTLALMKVTQRSESDWYHISIDEVNEIFPPKVGSDSLDYYLSPVIGMATADIRKAFVNLVLSAHTYSFVHPIIRDTTMYLIQLQNKSSYSGSPVSDKAVRALAIGQGYIEGMSPEGWIFEQFPFTMRASLRSGTEVKVQYLYDTMAFIPPWSDGSLDIVPQMVPDEVLYSLGLKEREDRRKNNGDAARFKAGR